MSDLQSCRSATLLKKRLAQSFPCFPVNFCEIFKNTFFVELLWMTASVTFCYYGSSYCYELLRSLRLIEVIKITEAAKIIESQKQKNISNECNLKTLIVNMKVSLKKTENHCTVNSFITEVPII